jgi:hypothetical protein
MKFQNKNTIKIVLESLFSTYSERVPDVKKITNAMVLKKLFLINLKLLMIILHLEQWALKI